MKKWMKKALCVCLLLTMSLTILATQAFAAPTFYDEYSFTYSYGLSLNECVIQNNVITECTGADQILIRSERFQVQVPGCYITATCSNYSTNTTTISTVGTVGLQYRNNADMPRVGDTVKLSMTLQSYAISKNVKATGSILAS